MVEFHKGTVVIDPNTIKWKLYQLKDGKWDELSGPVKTGKKVSYNFPQKWYTKKLLIEAYIFDAEGKSPPGLIIKPRMGDRKIKNTEILNAEGGKITKTLKYGQSITLRATTENMLGEILKLSVWERDTYSDTGHDPDGNQLLWSGNSKKVDSKGIAEQKIMLSPNMMMLANKSMFDGSEHEYYLLVEADKIKTMSATTQVSTEIVLSPGDHKVPKKEPIPEKETSLIDQAIVKIKNATGWDKINVEGVTNAVVDMPDELPKVEGIITAYFAKEEFTQETTETAGQQKYTFANNNDKIDKDKIADIIKNKVDAQVKADKKYTKLEDIKTALTATSYKKGKSISFNLYKLGANFIKINSAPLEEEVFVVAKTFLLDGKEVTIKIKEKEAVLVGADADLPVMEPKENGAEITVLKAVVDKGIAKVKIKIRPKANDTLATWNEKLAGIKDGTHSYTFGSNNTTLTAEQKKKIAGIIAGKVKTTLTEQKKFAKVDAIEKVLTKESYAKGDQITFDVYKSVTENLWLKAECQGTKKYEGDYLKKEGEYFVIGKGKEIIFPLLVKPENDIGNKWYNSYNWSAAQGNNMATFNTNRSGNRCGNWTRKHAARDLYTKPETEVVAVCKGIVLQVKDFYSKTDQVTVLHETNDGRKFIVRYGELAPNSITVKKDDEVLQRQKLGVTGKLLKADNTALLVRDGHVVYMLHFEVYSGESGYNIDIPLSNCEPPFARRNDLIEPLEILNEGYVNTFKEITQNTGDRVDANTLHFSQNGVNFLKGYETEIKKDDKHVYFNDGYGYCTIGYGHLIAGKNSCEKITIPSKFKDGLTDAEADALLFDDVQRICNLVKSKVNVPLYQYEFDALVSLAFNVEASVGSESTLLRLLNATDYNGAANEFKNWRVAAGVVSPGLVIRRAQETEIFKNNNYDSTH